MYPLKYCEEPPLILPMVEAAVAVLMVSDAVAFP